MASKRQDLVFAAIMVVLGLVVLFVWIPNDTDSGMIETFRRQTFIGDAFVPTLAAAALVVCAVVQLVLSLLRREDPTADADGLDAQSPLLLGMIALIVAVSLTLMFWAGPVAVSLLAGGGAEFGYRQARASFPWMYIGYLLGGFTLVFATTCLLEGRLSVRRVVTSILAVLVLVLIFDVPFDNILLPPNGDW